MTCAEIERTSAFLDGELTPEAADAAERHIATCAECQALVATAAEASELLRAPAARRPAPPELRARIARALDEEERTRALAAPRTDRWGGRSFWRGAASGVGASALAAGLAAAVLLPPTPGNLSSALADAHVKALASGRLVEVASSAHHTVKPWFAGRAPLSPPVQDFADQGYPLVGGRVDRVAGKTAAVLVYRHGPHEIDLYVWADAGRSPLPVMEERRGYRVLFGRKGDLAFAAVSDAQARELGDFMRLVDGVRE